MRPNLLAAVAVAAVGAFAWRALREAQSDDKRTPSATAHTYVLERTQAIPAPADLAFQFFERPENLGTITPKHMGFEITRVEQLPMQRGTTIEYRIRPLGIPQRWRTEILEYEPGRLFVDLQTKGPYRYWRHQHSFESKGTNTLMRDRVEYQLPLGPLGRLAHALILRRQLEQIFDYRTQAILSRFEETPA